MRFRPSGSYQSRSELCMKKDVLSGMGLSSVSLSPYVRSSVLYFLTSDCHCLFRPSDTQPLKRRPSSVEECQSRCQIRTRGVLLRVFHVSTGLD